MQLRQAGAEARARLIAAAAKQWNAPASEITIDNGVVKHASGKSALFGELVEIAQAIPAPQDVKPKDPSQWRYIGKDFARVDAKPKTNGTAVYTIDVKLPDMLTCVVARPARFGAKVKSFDPAQALAVSGVAEVFADSHGRRGARERFLARQEGRRGPESGVGRVGRRRPLLGADPR